MEADALMGLASILDAQHVSVLLGYPPDALDMLSIGLELKMDTDQGNKWFDGDVEDDGGVHIDQYDITSSPNDFNLVTLGSFIDRGAIRIPGFQRHFVWGRSSCVKTH